MEGTKAKEWVTWIGNNKFTVVAIPDEKEIKG